MRGTNPVGHGGVLRHGAAILRRILLVALVCTSAQGLLVTRAAAAAAWQDVTPTLPGPSARQEYSIIRDPAGHRLLLFGGYDGAYRNDLWELPLPGAGLWTQIAADGPLPAGRSSHTAIYDPVRNGMWIFGGSNGTNYLNDVHFLDLAAATPKWHPVTPINSPPSIRRSHSATYDPNGDQMILIGGYPYSSEVWALELYGTPSPAVPQAAPPTWQHLAVGNPQAFSARQGHLAAYDPQTHRVVVIGGDDGPHFLNDAVALQLDMGAPYWLQETITGTPPPGRRFCAGDYDPVGKQIILFGGHSASGLLNDVWSLSRNGIPAWLEITPSSPPAPTPRWVMSGVYDTNRFLMFGGSDAGGDRGDLWALSSLGCGAQTISASAGNGGSIAPAGAVSVVCGQDQTFTITPDPCRIIESVLVDGVPVTGIPASGPMPYTFTNVQTSHTIAATFGTGTAAAPRRLQAWWTFDDVTQSNEQKDLAHFVSGVNAGTLVGGASVIAAGMVGQALHCSGSVSGVGAGMVVTPAAGSVVFAHCKLGIDAWIRIDGSANVPTTTKRTIVALDNASFFVQDGQLGLGTQPGVPAAMTNLNPPLSPDTWHHVAVIFIGSQCVANRSPAFFVDGHQVTASGDVDGLGTVPSSINVGRSGAGNEVFEGDIDEVDIFRFSTLSTDSKSMNQIWLAGCAGKSREFVRLPLYADVLLNGPTTPVCAVLTNLTGSNYNYTLAIHKTCSVASIAPPQGPVSVPSGTHVEVPFGFTRTLKNSCSYEVASTNTSTQVAFIAGGNLPSKSSKLWIHVYSSVSGCEIPGGPQSRPNLAPSPDGTPDLTQGGAQFVVHNDSTVALPFAYRIEAVESDSLEMSDDVSLDGLPPGTPKSGSVQVPAGGTAAINVSVQVGSNNPFRTDQLVLFADTDGDAVMEPVGAALVEAAEDSTGDPLAVPPSSAPRPSLLAAPNPFHGRVTAYFTVSTSARVQVSVFDVVGRRVRSLVDGRLAPGTHHAEWDGTNDSGRAAGAGIYFVRVDVAGVRQQTRVVRLR